VSRFSAFHALVVKARFSPSDYRHDGARLLPLILQYHPANNQKGQKITGSAYGGHYPVGQPKRPAKSIKLF